MSSDPDAGNLCVKCGLCCNGALFDFGPLARDQVDQAREAGLKILRDGQKFGFGFPCPQIKGAVCQVYEKRPEACRSFRCTTLTALDRGEIDFGEGQARVAAAQSALQNVHEQLSEGMTLTDARRLRRQAAEAEASAELNASPMLMMALGMLDLVLDQHFRKPEQRQVMPIE